MRRREFLGALGGAAAAWPLTAHAQQPATPVIGFLRSTSRDDSTRLVDAIQQGLKLGGYVEGRNVAIEYRWADNQVSRLPSLAADLVARKVAVIVANQISTPAAKAATTTIPIVFVIGGDPVNLGFVTSLSRPDGNLTGLTFLTETLEAKRLEVMRELVPRAAIMGALVNPNNPNSGNTIKDLQDGARTIGVQLHIAIVGNEQDFEPAFAALAQKQVSALDVTGDGFLQSQRHQIVALAARHAIPTVYSDRVYVVAGGLLSYGLSQTEAYRQAGIYVGKILKGAKVADLPVEQSTKFEMVVNQKTANALGIDMPLSLLMRVTELIE
jgi:putative ABC transport system substrate-binding protein